MSSHNNTQQHGDEIQSEISPVGIEREVFGKWTVLLRNVGGILAVLVVCFTALFNSYTIYLSVKEYGLWPSETSMFIMMIGPVICAWQFMNASKTISTIMEIKGVGNRLRNRLATALATDNNQPVKSKQDND